MYREKIANGILEIRVAEHGSAHCHYNDGGGWIKISLLTLEIIMPKNKKIKPGLRKFLKENQEYLINTYENITIMV